MCVCVRERVCVCEESVCEGGRDALVSSCMCIYPQETRDGRVDSWRSFQSKGKVKKEKKNRTFLKPPKVKMEQRE